MRLGIIIARRKGSKTFEVLAGPEIPLPDQIEAFKRLKAGEAGDLEEIQLWNSSQGRARRHIFTGNPGINQEAILPLDKQKSRKLKAKSEAKSQSSPAGDKKPAGEPAKAPVGMQGVLLPGSGAVPPVQPASGEKTPDSDPTPDQTQK
jgi:hypothetical protein